MTTVTVEQVLATLKNVRVNGDGWSASCPLPQNHKHADKNPSLSISKGGDGQPLVRCHAGCQQKDVWAAICETVKGATPSVSADCTPEVAQRTDGKQFLGTEAVVSRMAAAFSANADGLAYLESRGISVEVAKKLNWGFSPWKFNGEIKPALMIPHYRDGQLVGIQARTMQGEKAVSQFPGSSIDGLYAVGNLNPSSDEVLILEGPVDAALAMACGFNATAITSAGSKVSQANTSPLCGYKRIFLIGDQDLPGKQAMDKLQAKLPPEQVVRVRLPGFKDIGEMWKANPSQFEITLQQALRLAQVSREYFDLDDLMTEQEVRERPKDFTPYVVDKLVPMNDITMFFGEEKSGKSLLATYILKCVANGVKVFGVLPVSKRPVLYLDLENSTNDIARFIEHFVGIGSEQIRYRTRVTGCPELNSPTLIRFCEKYHPLIVLDSLTKFLNGADPFHPGAVSEFFDKPLNLCAAGATIIVIHHSTKADAGRYADSHQIGANVARGFAVVSEDRPKLCRVRLEAKLCRGSEPSSFDLIAFPAIQEHGCFRLAEKTGTDVDAVVEFIRQKPDGCTRKEVKGVRANRKSAAITAALDAGRLIEEGGILRVPTGGNLENVGVPFPELGTLGTEQFQEEVISL